MSDSKPDTIVVLDFGGQYCHLIARGVRQLRVYSEILPSNIPSSEIQHRVEIKGIILSGGPSSVYEKDAPQFDASILETGIPVLGLCYGHQLIADIIGGDVRAGEKREYGITYVNVNKSVDILQGLNRSEKVWMSHGDTVYSLPDEYEILAFTDNTPIAAFRHSKKPIYGLQWHPEVTHTEHGDEVLRNFVFEICDCKANWKPESLIQKGVKEIRNTVNDEKAVIALSGGIDSGTVAVLASRALGEKLTAVFVDHGFMREGETRSVKEAFEGLGVRLVQLDERNRFFRRLKDISDPEEKRRIIGEEFIRVFEDFADKIGAEYLIQGTIYPDRIESGAGRGASTIKTHHNVGGLPDKIRFKAIIEPLRDLYKDEVREVAKQLGLSNELVWRQPFPGPGLAVRVMGQISEEKIEVVRKADDIVVEEVKKIEFNNRLWQFFAVLTDTKSTGVKGDARAYGYTVAVRVVESREAMTANFSKLPYDVLERISTRITNEIPQVVRVVYDITHKPPATIEWE
jgi:GMP synthase (glutamine-hydrolysing)